MDKTKEYCKYILDIYISLYDGKGSLYYELVSYIEKGVIKDVIFNNTNLSVKISYLNIYRNIIIDFFDKKIIIKSYEEYILSYLREEKINKILDNET